MSECTSTIIQLLKQVQYCTVVQLMTVILASLTQNLVVNYFQLYRCPNSGKVFDHITSSDNNLRAYLQTHGTSAHVKVVNQTAVSLPLQSLYIRKE